MTITLLDERSYKEQKSQCSLCRAGELNRYHNGQTRRPSAWSILLCSEWKRTKTYTSIAPVGHSQPINSSVLRVSSKEDSHTRAESNEDLHERSKQEGLQQHRISNGILERLGIQASWNFEENEENVDVKNSYTGGRRQRRTQTKQSDDQCSIVHRDKIHLPLLRGIIEEFMI